MAKFRIEMELDGVVYRFAGDMDNDEDWKGLGYRLWTALRAILPEEDHQIPGILFEALDQYEPSVLSFDDGMQLARFFHSLNIAWKDWDTDTETIQQHFVDRLSGHNSEGDPQQEG